MSEKTSEWHLFSSNLVCAVRYHYGFYSTDWLKNELEKRPIIWYQSTDRQVHQVLNHAFGVILYVVAYCYGAVNVAYCYGAVTSDLKHK